MISDGLLSLSLILGVFASATLLFAVALFNRREEKPTRTETTVVVYVPAPHNPPRPVQTVIHEHHYHVDNRSVTLLADQKGGVRRAVTVVAPAQAMPLLTTQATQLQRQRRFKVVGEREEWQPPEHNGWLPPGHSGMWDD